MKKRSPSNPQQTEKSQLNCMWGVISSLYFGQNHRKQKLLSNGKTASKHVIGKNPRKLDALTSISDRYYGVEDGAVLEALGVHTGDKRIKNHIQEEIFSDMQKNTQIIARTGQHKGVDYGLFDDMISKYKTSSKKTSKNKSTLYDWKDNEMGAFQQASGSAEMSINKLKLASILEAICNQIHQENGYSQKSIVHPKNDQLDEISLQVLQTSAKAFIDQIFIGRKYISKGGVTYEPEEFSDALEMLNSNGDLFLKLLQDPNSLLAKQIRSLHNVQMARDSVKSVMSDKLSDHQSSEGDIWKSEQKHRRSGYLSAESSTTRPSNKIVVLKPIPITVRCSENVACHCSSAQSHGSRRNKEENVKRKKFSLKDIQRKLKYAMGEKWKEKHVTSVGSSLHKFHSISSRQNFEVGNEGGSSCLAIARPVNSFVKSNTTNEPGNKQESISRKAPNVSFMTERVRKKLDVSDLSYTKKRELDISTEAKRHLSQRLNHASTTGEAVMSRRPLRTLERILSSPEHDLLVNYSSKQDSKSTPAQVRRNGIVELPSEPALTGVRSPLRNKDCQHQNSSVMDSHEVWSPSSSTDVSSSSPSGIYKLRVGEYIMDRGDHPSPVSVLEPVFTDDLASPSGNANQPSDTILRPRRLNFEGCSNNESPKKSILSRAEPDALCTYIQSCLQSFHLNWEELWLDRFLPEQMLDATVSDELETLALQRHSEPKLLMDCTNEVLLEAYDFHFRFPQWPSFLQTKMCSFPLEKHLVEKLMKEVRQHLNPVMEQPTLHEHAKNDLAKSGSWLDIRSDTEYILSLITDYVLEESILDTVLLLHNYLL